MIVGLCDVVEGLQIRYASILRYDCSDVALVPQAVLSSFSFRQDHRWTLGSSKNLKLLPIQIWARQLNSMKGGKYGAYREALSLEVLIQPPRSFS